MTSDQLNEKALEAACKKLWESTENYPQNWEHVSPGVKGNLLRTARRYASAYLAVAHPVVTTLEDLDKLPVGSVVSSGGREFYKTSYIDHPWILPYGIDRFSSGYLAKHSKVCVLHRPEVI